MHAVPGGENFDKCFQVRSILDHSKQNHLLCFGGWLFSAPLTFGLAGREIYCLGSLCPSHLQGCSLASGNDLEENWRDENDEKESIMHIRALSQMASVFVHCYRTMFLELSQAKNIDLRIMWNQFSFTSSQICLWFYKLGGGRVMFEVGIWLGYSERGCWGLKSGKAECGKMQMRVGFVLVIWGWELALFW